MLEQYQQYDINSLLPNDTIKWQILVNNGSDNGLVPDGTKPLP